MNLINESLFNMVIFGVIVNHVVIVIFYFLVIANTTAFYVPDWRFSERGHQVKLGCKMGRCMKKVENH